MDAVSAGLVGVGVTVFAGLIGAWIQSLREHSRWIRAERMKAYAAYLDEAETYATALLVGRKDMAPVVADVLLGLQRTIGNVMLVGPRDVAVSANGMRTFIAGLMVKDNVVEDASDKYSDLRKDFLVKAHKAIGIPDT